MKQDGEPPPKRSAGWILLNAGLMVLSWSLIAFAMWFWLRLAPLLWPQAGQ